MTGFLAYLRQDHESAWKLLSRHRKQLQNDDVNIDAFERALIVSGLRLNRFPDATKKARSSTDRDGDPYFLILVHAAQGEVDRAIQMMEQCLQLGYEPSAFYDDDFLGPYLQTAPYQDFRRRFPYN